MSEAAWEPPSELLRSPPRPVVLTGAGKAAAALTRTSRGGTGGTRCRCTG